MTTSSRHTRLPLADVHPPLNAAEPAVLCRGVCGQWELTLARPLVNESTLADLEEIQVWIAYQFQERCGLATWYVRCRTLATVPQNRK